MNPLYKFPVCFELSQDEIDSMKDVHAPFPLEDGRNVCLTCYVISSGYDEPDTATFPCDAAKLLEHIDNHGCEL